MSKKGPDITKARELAKKIRRSALEMVHLANASHIGGCLSSADLLAHFYAYWLNVRPDEPAWPQRDRFIMSKGHAAAALYAALAHRGFFPVEELKTYCSDDSALTGHVTCRHVPGVEVSTGSLGHGLPIGCGMALACRTAALASRVVVLMSDGDCQEGSTWEAALFAGHHELANLVAIVDFNKIQALGRVEDVLDLEPFSDKWTAFGWNARRINGHDHEEICETLKTLPKTGGKPTAIIADTIKGKGVSFMENQLAWHYKSPDSAQLAAALREIEDSE